MAHAWQTLPGLLGALQRLTGHFQFVHFAQITRKASVTAKFGQIAEFPISLA